MGITANETMALAKRRGADEVQEQTNSKAPALAEGGAIKYIKEPGVVGFVNVTSGGNGSGGFVSDGRTLPTGESSDVTQLSYNARYLYNRLLLPRGGLEQLSRREGVRMALVQLKKSAGQAVRQRARAFFGGSLGSPAATVTASSTTFTTADPSGFRNGDKIECRESDGTLRQIVQITNVAVASGTGNSTVTFTPANSVQWETSDVLYIRGQYSNGITSVTDVHAAASLYGHSQTADDWSGNLDSSTSTLSETAIRDLFDVCIVRSGEEPDCLVMHPQTCSTYMELFHTDMRFTSGGKNDYYGFKPTFDGKPIHRDPNFQKSNVLLHNEEDVKIHEFRPFGPASDGDAKKSGMAAAQLSPTSFAWDIQMHQSIQTAVQCRNSSALMTGITNS